MQKDKHLAVEADVERGRLERHRGLHPGAPREHGHGRHQGLREEARAGGRRLPRRGAGKSLTLTLGYSHLINYAIPDGITIETPTQTEIVVKGIDRQRVGQTAAEIRGFRPPEPYKGKGVKYSDEKISLKEAKKK